MTITTGFPSAARTAKKLGVSVKVLNELSSLAERSRRTGEFVLSGVDPVIRAGKKNGNPAAGKTIKVPAKRAVRFRAVK